MCGERIQRDLVLLFPVLLDTFVASRCQPSVHIIALFNKVIERYAEAAGVLCQIYPKVYILPCAGMGLEQL